MLFRGRSGEKGWGPVSSQPRQSTSATAEACRHPIPVATFGHLDEELGALNQTAAVDLAPQVGQRQK